VPGLYSSKALLPITVTRVTVIRRRLCLRRFFYFLPNNPFLKERAMEAMETIIQKINGCSTAIDLEKIVRDYLIARSEADNARRETYIETAERLGGDTVLLLANWKLHELDTGWLD
jgi:hypothetical protein